MMQGLLALGGVTGYVVSGSSESLLAGLGSATIIAMCAYASLQHYHKGLLCRPATAISLVMSSLLVYAMAKRYQSTGKVMPAGIVAILSAIMSAFYLWNLFLFKPNLKKSY